MARALTQLELLKELEPVAQDEVNRHLKTARDWNPHDYVPWDEGKNYAALGGGVRFVPDGKPPFYASLDVAGVPRSALRLVPGDRRRGAALVGAPEKPAVMFTGSTAVGRRVMATAAATG